MPNHTKLDEILDELWDETLKQAKQVILDLIAEERKKARIEAKQEFREKFMIDPTKKYNVTGTKRAVVIELAEQRKRAGLKGDIDE